MDTIRQCCLLGLEIRETFIMLLDFTWIFSIAVYEQGPLEGMLDLSSLVEAETNWSFSISTLELL